MLSKWDHCSCGLFFMCANRDRTMYVVQVSYHWMERLTSYLILTTIVKGNTYQMTTRISWLWMETPTSTLLLWFYWLIVFECMLMSVLLVEEFIQLEWVRILSLLHFSFQFKMCLLQVVMKAHIWFQGQWCGIRSLSMLWVTGYKKQQSMCLGVYFAARAASACSEGQL